MKKLRWGSKGPEVRLLQKYLGVTVDGVFGPKTEAAVKAFQAHNVMLVDGIVGDDTWCALEAVHRKAQGSARMYVGPTHPIAAKIQSVIDACHQAKTGYYKNPISDVARLKMPREKQYCAGKVKKPSAAWGTLASIGTCNMAQELAIALLAGAPPRIGANGSTSRWIEGERRNYSGLCGVDMVGPCTGLDSDSKQYKCHGSGQYFQDEGKRTWNGMVARMRDRCWPYAVACLDGGHVIGLHLSDHARCLVYHDPATGALVEDGAVLVLAADGIRAKPGQPTTILQRADDRRSKKSGRLYAWIGDLPDDGLRATIWEGGE